MQFFYGAMSQTTPKYTHKSVADGGLGIPFSYSRGDVVGSSSLLDGPECARLNTYDVNYAL